jgi:signal transduction histidine kinase
MKDNSAGDDEEVDLVEDPRSDVAPDMETLVAELAEVRASRMRLALAADAERRDLERVLHDGVQQILVGLVADLQLVAASVRTDPEAASDLLAEIQVNTLEASAEARRLAERIYPPMLDTGGLGTALRSAAEAADLTAVITAAIEEDLPPAVAGAVYLCWLDVLARVETSTPVEISVRVQPSTLTFRIVIGCDIDPEVPTRDLVDALGGRLTSRAGPGHRTEVTGSLPLP